MMPPAEIVEAALAPGAVGDCRVAVIVTATSQVNLRWADSRITTNGHLTGTEVDVLALAPHGGTATVSGQVRSRAELDPLMAAAGSAARAASPGADRNPLVAGDAVPQWHEPPDLTDADALQPFAAGLGRLFGAGDLQHFGYAERDVSTTYLGTSAGVRYRHTQTTDRAEFTAKPRARSGPTGGSAWVGSPDLRIDSDALAEQLRAGLAAQRTPVAIEPGRHRVILSPSAVADLMIDLYWSADARGALAGRNVFAAGDGRTRLGEQFGAPITLSSDPHSITMPCAGVEIVAAASELASPSDNGVPLQPTDWIADGTLQTLIGSRHTADAVAGAAAPFIDNLTLRHRDAAGSFADVVARTEDALLITCCWYNRVVDPQTLLLTGLTRDGVYVVRDGRIVGAAGNFRFNESPVGMLRRIVDASTEERTLAREMGDYFNRAAMPALTIDAFNLSTASEAS